ncbi:hypothetical protein T310_7117 [Rasamsonia emersonii CBS 393.64]|uniref:Uncharacterized protein n=1 Tax=Rasamsonia emersonii (strain ATCC 16479 / CBS 393.64 / IMI 116815) TaxID=1408163 RepID=A0A0F4YKU8_RASE3|nr:hypothetical protein T310_7117 [Rasamsonia emersonii CBS 393.64]KKA18922.1 hypothetical protein T310_7117 [Rasamsonia emersonii CBS 393.64]
MTLLPPWATALRARDFVGRSWKGQEGLEGSDCSLRSRVEEEMKAQSPWRESTFYPEKIINFFFEKDQDQPEAAKLLSRGCQAADSLTAVILWSFFRSVASVFAILSLSTAVGIYLRGFGGLIQQTMPCP